MIFRRKENGFYLRKTFSKKTDLKLEKDLYFPNQDEPQIVLEKNGLLTIRPGYVWNGMTKGITTDNLIIPTLVHDSLYDLLQSNLLSLEYRLFIDKLFFNMCLESGVNVVRAHWIYYAVRFFGESYALPKDKK